MSEPGFEELQRLWQSASPSLASAQKIILRQRRRRWLSHLYLGAEIVITLVSIPVLIWITVQPRGFWVGLGMLLMVIILAGGSLWARSLPRARAEGPLLESIEQAVRRARIGVRLAYAGIWGIAAAMIIIGGFALLWASPPDLSPRAARAIIMALGLEFAWFAIVLAGTLLYLWARSRELTQLTLVREALHRLQ
jgi:hypothetical protein